MSTTFVTTGSVGQLRLLARRRSVLSIELREEVIELHWLAEEVALAVETAVVQEQLLLRKRLDALAEHLHAQRIAHVDDVAQDLFRARILLRRQQHAAIDLHNKKNKVIRDFCAAANHHLDLITAVTRHHVMKALTFMKPEDIIEKLSQLTAALNELPDYEWTGKKVILTGITAEPDDMLAGFTANNIAVVGDDLMQESRLYRTDYPAANSAMESLALQWLNIKGCSMAHDDNSRARGEHLVSMVEENGADAVVLCMMRFCDTEEYDQPYIIKMVQDAGYMAFSIDIDQSTSDSGQALTKIQAFAEN